MENENLIVFLVLASEAKKQEYVQLSDGFFENCKCLLVILGFLTIVKFIQCNSYI